MSELGKYIKDDFKDMIYVSHFFIDKFFGMIGYIFSFIGNIFIKILENAKFFFGLMIPLLIIIIIFARDKKYGLILYSMIFAILIVLLLIGVISVVVKEIDSRVKTTSSNIERFNRAAKNAYTRKAILFFQIIGNIIVIILLIIIIFVLFYLIGLYQVFVAFIKNFVDNEPPFVQSVSDNNNNSNSNSNSNNNSNSNSNSNKPATSYMGNAFNINKYDVNKVSEFLSGMYKSVDKRLGNPFGSDC